MRRSERLELQKRIRIIQEWILNDYTSADIIRQCLIDFKVSDRQAYRYLWAARKFFDEKDTRSLKGKVSYYLARKKKLLRDMDPKEKRTAAGVAAQNKVLDSMAKMEGVTMDTLKLVGDPEQPLVTKQETTFKSSIDYSLFPTEFLDQVLANRKQKNV